MCSEMMYRHESVNSEHYELICRHNCNATILIYKFCHILFIINLIMWKRFCTISSQLCSGTLLQPLELQAGNDPWLVWSKSVVFIYISIKLWLMNKLLTCTQVSAYRWCSIYHLYPDSLKSLYDLSAGLFLLHYYT